MRHLLNTLYVTTNGTHLSREGDTVLARVGGETKLQLPVHTLSGIVCFGGVFVTPPLMSLCAERGIGISFLSEHGRFLARVQGPVSGNVLLRREQYRNTENEGTACRIARSVVLAKIANCRTVLMRTVRDREKDSATEVIAEAAAKLAEHLRDLEMVINIESIRGKEGDAARRYFGVFDHLISSQKEHFFFHERSRRPPLDNMNALLSFVYTLLVHDVASALEVVGLDPQVGYFHQVRPGRPALALDMMEELRPFLGDRLALSLVNLNQVKNEGFTRSESGGVVMDDQTRKVLLAAYQKRKQEEIKHPFLNETIAIGLLPYTQALLLARHLRGDLDGYPPFFWK